MYSLMWNIQIDEGAQRKAEIAEEKAKKPKEEEEAKMRDAEFKLDAELKLDAAKKTVDNLVFAAADKKTPKDAFKEGTRVGKLLFWRAIERNDECMDKLIPDTLKARLEKTLEKDETPPLTPVFIDGVMDAYRKLARRIPPDRPKTPDITVDEVRLPSGATGVVITYRPGV
jgi:hypothetical protein